MQRPSSRLWLLPAMVAVASGTASLTFDADSFTDGFSISNGSTTVQTSIFSTESEDVLSAKTFTWQNTTRVTIRNVYLGNDQTRQIIAQGSPSQYSAESATTRRDAGVRGDPGIYLNISPSTAGGTVSIDPAGLKILSTDFRLVPLVFQIQWAEEADALADSSVDDYSYSQVWGLAANISEAEDMYETNSAFNYVVQPRAQSTSPLLPVSAQTTAAGPTTTATAPIAPGSTASSSSSSSDDSSPKSNASKRVGPLSTSALIGIIVGGVALVMLVLIVAIFCTRRHRRRPTQSHGDHDRDTQDLMADKEARAAGTAPDTPYSAESSQPRNVAPVSTGPGDGSESGDSPPAETHPAASSSSPSSSSSLSVSLHEPYAELAQEEQLNNQTASHATAGAPVSPSHDAGTEQSPLSSGGSLLPEEARPRAGGGGGSSSSKTGTPQMGSTRLLRSDTPGGRSISDYLHEDGMTEDDIRRLEAEERALDEAIEQARTDSRAGRGR